MVEGRSGGLHYQPALYEGSTKRWRDGVSVGGKRKMQSEDGSKDKGSLDKREGD